MVVDDWFQYEGILNTPTASKFRLIRADVLRILLVNTYSA